MKRILKLSCMFAVVLLVCLGLGMRVDAAARIKTSKTNFPDKTIRKLAKSYDKNKDGYLSEKEIKKVKSIEIEFTEIETLKGIEKFSSLEELTLVSVKKLKTLDFSACKKLKKLTITYAPHLKKIKFGNINTLREITIGNCKKLQEVDVKQQTNLKVLRLNILPKVKSINLKKNVKLQKLQLFNIPISKIDLSKNTKLNRFGCGGTKLNKLNLVNTKIYGPEYNSGKGYSFLCNDDNVKVIFADKEDGKKIDFTSEVVVYEVPGAKNGYDALKQTIVISSVKERNNFIRFIRENYPEGDGTTRSSLIAQLKKYDKRFFKDNVLLYSISVVEGAPAKYINAKTSNVITKYKGEKLTAYIKTQYTEAVPEDIEIDSQVHTRFQCYFTAVKRSDVKNVNTFKHVENKK